MRVLGCPNCAPSTTSGSARLHASASTRSSAPWSSGPRSVKRPRPPRPASTRSGPTRPSASARPPRTSCWPRGCRDWCPAARPGWWCSVTWAPTPWPAGSRSRRTTPGPRGVGSKRSARPRASGCCGWCGANERGAAMALQDGPRSGGSLVGNRRTVRAARRSRAWRAGQLRQVSLSVSTPFAGTVALRLAPDSQVTAPEASLRMYLYWNAVPAGSATLTFHTG